MTVKSMALNLPAPLSDARSFLALFAAMRSDSTEVLSGSAPRRSPFTRHRGALQPLFFKASTVLLACRDVAASCVPGKPRAGENISFGICRLYPALSGECLLGPFRCRLSFSTPAQKSLAPTLASRNKHTRRTRFRAHSLRLVFDRSECTASSPAFLP